MGLAKCMYTATELAANMQAGVLHRIAGQDLLNLHAYPALCRDTS